MCPGAAFATIELTLLTAIIAQRVRFRIPEGVRVIANSRRSLIPEGLEVIIESW